MRLSVSTVGHAGPVTIRVGEFRYLKLVLKVLNLYASQVYNLIFTQDVTVPDSITIEEFCELLVGFFENIFCFC